MVIFTRELGFTFCKSKLSPEMMRLLSFVCTLHIGLSLIQPSLHVPACKFVCEVLPTSFAFGSAQLTNVEHDKLILIPYKRMLLVASAGVKCISKKNASEFWNQKNIHARVLLYKHEKHHSVKPNTGKSSQIAARPN